MNDKDFENYKLAKNTITKENLGKYLNLDDIDIQFEFKPFVNDFEDVESFAVIFENGMPIKAFEVSAYDPLEGDPTPREGLNILYNEIKNNLEKYITLPDISLASKALKQAYRGSLENEDGMYYFDNPTDKEIEELEDDAKKFGLEDVIENNPSDGGTFTYAGLMFSFNDDEEVNNIIKDPQNAIFFDKDLRQTSFAQMLESRDLCNKLACDISSDFLTRNYSDIATKELDVKETNVKVKDYSTEDNSKIKLEVETKYESKDKEKFGEEFRNNYFKHIKDDLISQWKKNYPNVIEVSVFLYDENEGSGFGKTFNIDELEEEDER